MRRITWILAAIALAAACRTRPLAPAAAIPLTGAKTEWRGLSEIYRETLVGRAPEVLRFPLVLPESPWLDLSLGTSDDAPVTFRVGVEVRPSSQFGEPPKALLIERTVTRGNRWEPAGIDLSAFAGQKVALTLGLESDPPGAIGFWGSPVVRDRGRPLPAGAPRGVILIRADGLRRDHLGAYGYGGRTSPHIDRLASEGAAFDACAAQTTGTSAVETLAETFRGAGYATVSYSGLRRGFEEVDEPGSLSDKETGKTAREYVDRLLPWLMSHKDVPFFVFLDVSGNGGWEDGSIHAMDAEIGRLMEHLRAVGLAGETLVVFTGGDGERTNVPLIFHFPGTIAAGRRVSETVAAIDITPTLLALSGIPPPKIAPGVSRVPLLTGPDR